VKIDCQLVPPLHLAEPGDRLFVVIDVLRATSTITTAFMNGCKSIVPVAEVEEAFRLANGPLEGALIGGERGGLTVKGFDLGNSPREYSSDRVRGQTIIMTTTNGSRAFRSLPENATGIVSSFLNLAAVASRCLRSGRDVMIISSGQEGGFSLEDTVCAGGIVRSIRKQIRSRMEISDSALAAEILYDHFKGDLLQMFRLSFWGRYLMEIGAEADLEYCAKMDVTTVVPIYREGRIGLAAEG